MSGLSEELRSVRAERDALISAQSGLNEDHQRLKEQMANALDQMLKMESHLVDAQLKEAEPTQHLMETLEQVQTDLQEMITLSNHHTASGVKLNRMVSHNTLLGPTKGCTVPS